MKQPKIRNLKIDHPATQLMRAKMSKVKMVKKKTYAKPKKSSKNTLTPYKFDASLFQDQESIKEILVESLSSGDMDTFRDVLVAFLKTQSTTSFARKSGLGRQTIYDMIHKPEKCDPQASTVAKIFLALAA